MIGICDTKSTLGTAKPAVCLAKYCFCATKSRRGNAAGLGPDGWAALSTDGGRRITGKHAGTPSRGRVSKAR
jgi:hypothetical protein